MTFLLDLYSRKKRPRLPSAAFILDISYLIYIKYKATHHHIYIPCNNKIILYLKQIFNIYNILFLLVNYIKPLFAKIVNIFAKFILSQANIFYNKITKLIVLVISKIDRIYTITKA